MGANKPGARAPGPPPPAARLVAALRTLPGETMKPISSGHWDENELKEGSAVMFTVEEG